MTLAQASVTPELHLLLVEDNPSDAGLLEELLEDGHHRIALYCTDNGHDAMNFLQRQDKYRIAPSPDAILLDLGLPRVNGYEVLSRLQKTSELSKIPVIVLTTSRDPKDRELCLSLGAKGFLSKPYNLEDYEVMIDDLTNNILPTVCHKRAA